MEQQVRGGNFYNTGRIFWGGGIQLYVTGFRVEARPGSITPYDEVEQHTTGGKAHIAGKSFGAVVNGLFVGFRGGVGGAMGLLVGFWTWMWGSGQGC